MAGALAQAAVLPNRDHRPRPPSTTSRPEEPQDLSEEAIFLKLRMTFTRPEGIEGERWYEMLTSFARRKAEEARAEREAEQEADPGNRARGQRLASPQHGNHAHIDRQSTRGACGQKRGGDARIQRLRSCVTASCAMTAEGVSCAPKSTRCGTSRSFTAWPPR